MRWVGIILMILAVVTGVMMHYMLSAVTAVSPTEPTRGVFIWNICICVPLFFIGLIIFAVGSSLRRDQQDDEARKKARKRRRRKEDY
jgi:hypothetical protein